MAVEGIAIQQASEDSMQVEPNQEKVEARAQFGVNKETQEQNGPSHSSSVTTRVRNKQGKNPQLGPRLHDAKKHVRSGGSLKTIIAVGQKTQV